MGHRKKAFVDQSMLQAGEGRPAVDLIWLRWLGVWGSAAFGALLLWFTLAFHHDLPLWLFVLLVLGISAAGVALFSWLIFAQIRQREEILAVRARQEAAVAELGQRALARTDLSILMNNAVALVAHTLEVEFCKVLELLPAGTALLLRAGMGWKDGSVGSATVGAGTDSQAGYTLLSNEPVIVDDLRTEPRFSEPPLLRDHGVVSGMSVIIPGGDRPFGVLGAYTTRRRTFSQDDSHFLQAIGNLLATAIERKRAEEALKEANDTLEAVIQASPMGITILDPDGNVKLWNPAAERIFGWQEEEVLRRSLPSIPDNKRQEHRALRERVLRGEGFSGIDVVRQKKDGSLVDISLSTAPLRDAKGDICGAMGIMADITERKRAEESLHALYRASLQIQEPLGLRQRLDRLLQTAQTLLELDRINILLADPEGRMLHAVASHGVEEPLEAIQVPIGPEGGGIAQAYLTRRMIVWDGLAPVPEQLRLQPPYDRIAAFRSQVFANVPLVVQGRAIGVLGADRKHSRRPLDGATLELLQLFSSQAALAIEHGRLYEEQRLAGIQLEATVEARTRELHAANRRLEEASRHKSEFLATMSHELRTPLNSIIGFSELLQDQTFGALTAKQARYVDNVHKSGKHLLALISDLLDLSKVEAGKLEIQPETFSLLNAIKTALSTIWPQAEAKQQRLEFQVDDDLSTIRADPVRFKEILCNLLSNAVKFTPDAGRITVTAQRGSRGEMLGSSGSSPLDAKPYALQSAEFIEIAVADTGVGITPEDLPKLFQPFAQLDSPLSKQFRGSGLGLALTKQLVELHRGQIWAASAGEGRGSTFTVRLPMSPQGQAGRGEDAPEAPGSTPRPAPGG